MSAAREKYEFEVTTREVDVSCAGEPVEVVEFFDVTIDGGAITTHALCRSEVEELCDLMCEVLYGTTVADEKAKFRVSVGWLRKGEQL